MFEPPVEAKLERELTAPLLQRILVTVIISGLALSVVSTAADFRKTLCLALGNTFVAAAMLSLAKHGFLRIASVVVVSSLLLTTVHAMYTGEGLYDDSLLIVPGIFVVSSLLLSPRWLLVIVAFALLAVVGLGVAQLNGLAGEIGRKEPFTYHYVLEVVILLGALATFVHYLVTLMRRSILEARSAHESLRDILDATSEASIIHRPEDGKVVSVNATALAMFGYPRSEFIGLGPAELMSSPEVDEERFSEASRELMTGKNVQPIEWRARRKDGSQLWIEVAIRHALIAGAPRLIAVARDITRRRLLEQRVREAEMFRAVGQLAGGVAHDFNNQLVGILGNAEFLREELSVDADLSACADAIIASGRRAADLTQQLLAFARRGRLRNIPIDVHQVIAEVIALGKRSIDKRISIEQDTRAARATVLGDASALQNALLNLMLNARDAMPRGGTIRFGTRLLDECRLTPAESWSGDSKPPIDPSRGGQPQRVLEISVSDTGTGIAPEIAGRIFEPFFTTKENGNGMGLAAVRGTVADHHGSIEVHSEPGHGATFRMRLPICNEQPKPESIRPRDDRVGAEGRILVVDDEPAVANVCRMALERGGYRVETCSGGQRALELCSRSPFDLVLLDVMMPDMDGVEVLRRVREFDNNTRVVLMTGNASESVEARLADWPDVSVLSKPMMPKEILDAARRQLARQR